MSDALEVIGDRHSLPLLRELHYGYRRFSDLAAQTGAPRTLLTGRLRKLEEAGVIGRRRYSVHPPRFDYVLTPAGAALLPVILTLKEWGERYAADAADAPEAPEAAGAHDSALDAGPKAVFQHSCGAELHPLTVCAACRQEIGPGEIAVVGGTHPPVLQG